MSNFINGHIFESLISDFIRLAPSKPIYSNPDLSCATTIMIPIDSIDYPCLELTVNNITFLEKYKSQIDKWEKS